ncbi:MAG: hypothetical protein J6W52_03075 [Bacteroidaceae bacterium]|nr:hypothetical protein [Bacteroidaceae bacterium]
MKPRYIVLFIICLLAGLALLCMLFPSGGIRLGDTTLRFPTLTEALDVPEEPVDTDTVAILSPEEIMEQRLEALKTEKMDEFHEYCQQDASRLYLPDDDETYLDAFFEKMQNAGNRHLRIMHYGDSQIECDRITSFLRQEFQEEFGGQGVGLIPALQTVPTYTTGQSLAGGHAVQYMAFGPKGSRGSSDFYGPMAKRTELSDTATISITARGGKDYSHSCTFNKITVLTKDAAKLNLMVRGDTIAMDSANVGEMYFYTARIGGASSATIGVKGRASILGIQLDGARGVNVDNLPMRGCSGPELMNINRASIRPFLARENVGLILLQYGGNSVPYLTKAKLPGYKERMKNMIGMFRQMAPEARIIFIGPSDMATSDSTGAVRSYGVLPETVKTLREAANESGAAFWNMYEVMGGNGSMAKWVRSGLAGSDYVHFTPSGAKKMAHMLYETLQFYYRFYRFRTGQDKVELPEEDSLAVDSL